MADVKGVGGLVETLKIEVERLKDQQAVADALASDEATKPRRRSPPSQNWRSGSKQWRPSAPSSRGGSGFSGGPDEASQP
jgi:hypothetical protein